MSYEETYKDGGRDGLSTVWDENGKKSFERTFKESKERQFGKFYYKSGLKKREVSYWDLMY